MDSPETKIGTRYVLLRRSFALFFTLFAILSSSFLLGFVVFYVGNSSIMKSISVPSHCKIVSSSVDLRSSKVCELGLQNYNTKLLFYPFEGSKFRCRYDYYWASVFKVEYNDHSGRTRFAWAEAPNEALPLDCRPNFGAAWLTKDRFQVNETYDCWYTFGVYKVNIYHDNFFNCQANDPSTAEMLRRYSILFAKILRSWFSGMGRVKYLKWQAVAGVIAGFSTSLISISLFALLHHQMKVSLPRLNAEAARTGAPLAVYKTRVKRACFLVAYFSFAGWFAICYGKRLGLIEL